MSKEGILRDAHGIHDTTGAIMFLATMMGIRIREDDFHPARRHTGARARTLTPVVIPATHHLHGKLIHVMIVLIRRLTTIQRTVTFFMKRITLLIPVFAQALITTVFHRPHGVLLTFVDIEHLAAILSLIDVKHLTTTNGSSAIRIVLITDSLHFQHVFTTDTLVATLVEKY